MEKSEQNIRLIKILLHLTISEPDISFQVSQLCQFMSQPTYVHRNVALNVLKYLIGTYDFKPKFSSSKPLSLFAFHDADGDSLLI